MKKTSLFLILGAIFFSSCSKEELTGDVTFWQQTNSGYGITVVELNGNSANITSEYNSAPDCGTSGCAVFNNLVEGSYNYTASDGDAIWSGTVNIEEGCLKMRLY